MLKNLLLHFKTLADYIAKRDDTKNYGIPSDSITFVDESRRINTFNTDYYCGTSQLGSMAYKSSLQFSEVTSKPTSLSGYGITDGVNGVSVSGSGNAVTSASVSGHTLTLTKGTTFLTSHQAVSNKGATLSWGAAVTIATIGNTNINVSLPANPNTDTKNTAGSTDTSSKIFLIGATSQAANPQTYSHDTAYVGTDGCLYSGGAKVLTSHQSLANYLWANGASDFDPSSMDGYYAGMTTKSGITTDRWHILSMNWGTTNTIGNKLWASQLALPTQTRRVLRYRTGVSTSAYSQWVSILDETNYNSYAPTKTGGGASGTWGISITGNAASATSSTKATQDSAGQQINTTYIKSLSVSGTTITYTKGDGTTGTITTQDTNTDTKNTAGTTNLTATKLYIAGATSQAANPQTYSNVNVYIGTDNCLYSGGVKVLTAHQTIYDLTIQGNGTTIGTFDPNGAAKTINITPANIGAAASGHTHSQYAKGIDIGEGVTIPTENNVLTIPSYVHKDGGEFTGDVTIPYLTAVDGIESGGNVQAPGFKVEGSSNSNIVLAGGGTKAVSDFSAAGHTHSYLPLSGGTLTGNLTCNKDLYSNYIKPIDGSSNIYIGDSNNSAYVTFVEDMQGSDDNGDGTWYITNSGDATFNNITTATMRVQTSLEVEKILTDNIKTSASGLKVQKSDYVLSYAQIGPSGQIELYAGTPFIDFHYNNSTTDYSTRIVCDTSTRLSVLATTFRASNAITCVSLTQTSDERLKENIKDIDEEFIEKLFATDNGFIHQFDFKDSKRHSNGIIAQEVKDIMPEVVDYDETDDVYRVDYTSASMKLIGAMFKKIKQMQEEIETLKAQNNKN